MPPHDDLPYRPNVGIMVLNREGKAWVGHRCETKDTEYQGFKKLWQMPQGGIDKNEDPEPAALRELYEETGISSVSLLEATPDWICYELSARYSCQDRHKIPWPETKMVCLPL